MSEDKQDNEQIDNSNDDAVVEQRVAKKQGSSLVSLIIFGLLIGTGVAAGYYHSMWLPQAKQLLAKYVPMQKESDPMAAPSLPLTETEQSSEEITSSDPAVTTKKSELVEGVVNELPVIPATTDLVAKTELSDDVKDVANDVVLDEEPVTNSISVEANENALVASNSPVTESVPVEMPAVMMDINKTNVVSLAQARQAFWARDLVKAEILYRKLLNAESGSTDAWGELGNLYYGQAKWPQAAEAYSEAAIQLLEQKKYQQAMFLHYLVRGLDPVQAERIDEKLRDMQATPHR